jgi:dTDP-4-dehydrorhamnose 3,5-epimerase
MSGNYVLSGVGEIAGVKVLDRRKIPDERGTILHGVRQEELLNPFGEVYFKKLYPGGVNGWHVHEKLVLNYLCLSGMLKLVLFDVREDSATHGLLQELFIGEDNHCLVHIPAGIANGAKSLTTPYALMCNIASHPHDPQLPYRRIDPNSGVIPYDWARKDY